MGKFSLQLFCFVCVCSSCALFAADDAEFFETKIRPVLADNCYSCHSTKSKKLKAKLFSDSLQGLLKGGESGPSVVPGKPEASKLIEAVTYKNVDLQMPPDGKLKDEQIADLTEWVKRGAIWPGSEKEATRHAGGVEEFDLKKRKAEFWCWQPVASKFQFNSVDQFIQAKLKEKNLEAAPQADKRALIRRAYFDLVGLPPKPDEVEAFVADNSPDAYAKVIDRLLASPHFGERWGRHWLDLVRYAETLGHEFDFTIPNAYRYRDYAIRAFNADVPYNDFVVEHIAGDLLEKPRRNLADRTNESVIGTGFYFLGEGVHSPVDVKQWQADRFDNAIDVMTKAFVGLTVSCARCHDHKFDAISTQDYYSMYGFLKSSRYTQSAVNADEIAVKAAELAKIKDEIRKTVGISSKASAEQSAKYLLASREVLYGAPSKADNQLAKKEADIVFDDFEKEAYDGWTTTGTAFGSSPCTQATIAPYQGNVGASGNGFVNSHNSRRTESPHNDADTGTLTSRTFKIERSYVHFLIDGGAHKDRTCVNLLIDEKAVRSTTGKNENRMSPAIWDVRDLQGKTARIQVVDNESGGWGNIGIDRIVFSNSETNAGATPKGRPVAAVAAEKGVDPAILERWVHALQQKDATTLPNPMFGWNLLARCGAESGPELQKSLQNLREMCKPPAEASAEERAQTESFIDFATYQGQWVSEGSAFGAQAATDGDILVGASAERPVKRVFSETEASSAVLSTKLEGVLRSDLFRIEKDYIHIFAAGHEGRINIVIDNFTLIRAPIYGGLRRVINNAELAWHTFDLKMWKGHQAYIELNDTVVGDLTDDKRYPADSWISLQNAQFSNKPAPSQPRRMSNLLVERTHAVETLSSAAESYQGDIVSSLGLWRGVDWPQRTDLLDWLFRNGLLAPDANGKRTLESLLKKYAEIEAAIPQAVCVPAMADGKGRELDEHVFIRGSHKNLGAVASRGFLTAIQPSLRITKGSGRLELAEKFVEPSNPLTARVYVNRIWHHLFGRGIVASVDNFGKLGEMPTHPELLDFLAVRFVNEGWSTKKLIRELMLTQVYQMGSRAEAKFDELDPDNKFLHRANIRRLEGEIIRDEVLAISGRLDAQMFGPSVDVHLTAFMTGRGQPRSGPLDGAGRRSIYIAVKRNFLTPMLLAFDMPIPFSTIGKRASSNVPAQALTMMNDPFILQQADVWAKRVLAEPNLSSEQRITKMYLTAFARAPKEGELLAAKEFIAAQQKELGVKENDAKVWGDFAHVLMNAKEFIFLN